VAKSLRTVARGQPCYLRLEGCSYDPEQTVLAHIRRGNVAGVGQKPDDVFAIPCCAPCHDRLDGRIPSGSTRAELDAEVLRALGQWLTWLRKQEVLTVCL
jgi:hypothetical protein